MLRPPLDGDRETARASRATNGTLPPVLATMVLAAGLGTRLRPLTEVCAKPLVPVGDRPILEHVLDKLRAAGVTRVVVNAHHRAGEVRDFIRKRSPHVVVSEESELLGTAGGLSRAADALGAGDVLVWNADTLADVDSGALVAAHTGAPAGAECAATLVVRSRERGQGNVGLDGTGRVVRLRQERIAEEARGGDFLGIHVVGSALRARLPERGCLVADLYIPALRGGALLRAFLHGGPFFDVGTVEGYLDANLAWLEATGIERWVAPGARVDSGVSLERTVVCAGASVLGSGTLERCVVWPGATAVTPLADAVVAAEHVVLSRRC
jgi:mannose-1-phosphate guanylyltransferase